MACLAMFAQIPSTYALSDSQGISGRTWHIYSSYMTYLIKHGMLNPTISRYAIHVLFQVFFFLLFSLFPLKMI